MKTYRSSFCKEEYNVYNLQFFLTPKQLIFSKIPGWVKEHINHNMIQISLRSCAPFDDNKECEITKEAVEKDHLWHKLIPEKGVRNQNLSTLSWLVRLDTKYTKHIYNIPYIKGASMKLCIKVTQYDA